jgi:hypothetical protein
VITLESEILPPPLSGLLAQGQVLLQADEVGRKLRRGQLCAHPFAGASDGTLELRLIGFREHTQLRHHEPIDQLEHARVLFDRGLGVHSRDTRRIENGAHLLQQPGQLVQPCSDFAQSLSKRSEIASHQQVHRCR